ncbi:hypothetical protein OAY51_01595 [Candidatus Pelagibacter sp.]|nr:hypothetical protein [Candidatus Pelagibacter sp.]
MDEDISIINTNTRNEKIKSFFIQNKKKIISVLGVIVLLLIGYFAFGEYQNSKKIKISNSFNSITINFSESDKQKTAKDLIQIINEKNPTYSPLSLYFIIDNELIKEKKIINELFDIIINETSLEKEIKNLNIYKKALYNADDSNESELLDILNPLIKSESVWKSHALYLMAEYFYSKNELQKSKEFFNQIVNLENANQEIKLESQKRLNRDLSE